MKVANETHIKSFDPYDILEISMDASEHDIRKAFRLLLFNYIYLTNI